MRVLQLGSLCLFGVLHRFQRLRFSAVLLVAAFFVSPQLTRAAPVCWFKMVPCFIACGNPPPLADADQAALWLRPGQYERISRFDQASAVVTTQFFKCIGINGWKRYGFRVYAVGRVKQAATSWDGLRTIDIVLTDFDGSLAYRSLPATHYIRAEVVRHVWKHLNSSVCPGDRVRIEGELHWDGHGFLEIHPSKTTDVQFVSIPGHSKGCVVPK